MLARVFNPVPVVLAGVYLLDPTLEYSRGVDYLTPVIRKRTLFLGLKPFEGVRLFYGPDTGALRVWVESGYSQKRNIFQLQLARSCGRYY